MPGWRIGFAAGNARLVGALTRIKSYLDYGAFTPVQVAATAALNGPQDCVAGLSRALPRRGATCWSTGWPRPAGRCRKPDATMFCWAPVPEPFEALGSLGFAKLLLEEAEVAVAPGHRLRRVWRGLCPAGAGREPAPAAAGRAQHPQLPRPPRQRRPAAGAGAWHDAHGAAPLRIGIAGLGTVGAGTFRLLRDNARAALADRTGRPLAVTAVSARDRGRARGLDLAGVRWHDDAARAGRGPRGRSGLRADRRQRRRRRSISSRAALRRGRPVVTANKAMLALHGAELARLAEGAGAQLALRGGGRGRHPDRQVAARGAGRPTGSCASTASSTAPATSS